MISQTAQYENLHFTIKRDPLKKCCHITISGPTVKIIQTIVVFGDIKCRDFSFEDKKTHVIIDSIESSNDIFIKALSVTIFGRLFAEEKIKISATDDIIKKSPQLRAKSAKFSSETTCIFKTQKSENYSSIQNLINCIINQDGNVADSIVLLLNNIVKKGLNACFVRTPSLEFIPSRFLGVSQDKFFYSYPPLFPIQPNQKNSNSEKFQLTPSESILMSINTIDSNYLVNCGKKRFYIIYDIRNFKKDVAWNSFVIFATSISINTSIIMNNIKNAIFIESIRTEGGISISQINQHISHIGNLFCLFAKTINLGKVNTRFLGRLQQLRAHIQNLASDDPSLDWKKSFIEMLQEIYYPYSPRIDRNTQKSLVKEALSYFNIQTTSSFPQELPTTPLELPISPKEPFSLFTNDSLHARIFS